VARLKVCVRTTDYNTEVYMVQFSEVLMSEVTQLVNCREEIYETSDVQKISIILNLLRLCSLRWG